MAGYFKAVRWTGDGSVGRRLTLGFQAEYGWTRQNTAGGAVRGFLFGLATSYCNMGDQNGAWTAATAANALTADATGLTLGSEYNTNLAGYIGLFWCSSPNIAYRLSYTGNGAARSVNHSLGVTPDFIYPQWYPAAGAGGTDVTLLSMPLTRGFGMVNIQDFGIAGNNKFTTANNNIWNSSAPTSTVYNLGGAALQLNTNLKLYYAMMFANSTGYCKTGTYVGDGATNGAAINLNFAPAAIQINRADNVANGDLPYTFAAVMTDPLGATSPWTKFFLMPDAASWRTDANGIVISGNTFAPPLSLNTTGVTYSYIAWSEADTSGGGGGAPGWPSSGRGRQMPILPDFRR